MAKSPDVTPENPKPQTLNLTPHTLNAEPEPKTLNAGNRWQGALVAPSIDYNSRSYRFHTHSIR